LINFRLNQKNELAQALGELLLERNATVATVESCTGGGVAFALTDVAGSSAWFEQSWVTYSNRAKHQMVGVQQSTLAEFGAVSKQVVIEMAEGGARIANAEYCVAISGVAGPGGGTADKPVGLVWFAIAGPTGTISFNRRFSGDRQLIREQAIALSLEKLIQSLVN